MTAQATQTATHPPRVRLDSTFAHSPSAWCGCGVTAAGEHAAQAIRAHLRNSPSCRSAMFLQVVVMTKRDAMAEPDTSDPDAAISH